MVEDFRDGSQAHVFGFGGGAFAGAGGRGEAGDAFAEEVGHCGVRVMYTWAQEG